MLDQSTALMRPEADEYLEIGPLSDVPGRDQNVHRALPALITRAASKQAYYTIRFLVDRDCTLNAYRAYAYFRWVDDTLDQPVAECARTGRLAFIDRQQTIADGAYRGERQTDLARAEQLLVDLIRSDDQRATARARANANAGGLRSYIENMMAVMAFDADRRGRLVTARELEQYTRHLAVAVTDALHYFIGQQDAPPLSEARYLPAMAAHISHMLRDTFEDMALGYFNVPRELLESSGLDPSDVASAAYRNWVKHQVQVARAYFAEGEGYLRQVKSARCRLAGYAYMARFAGVLDAIEREEYRLRPTYREFTGKGYALRMGGSVFFHTLLRGKR